MWVVSCCSKRASEFLLLHTADSVLLILQYLCHCRTGTPQVSQYDVLYNVEMCRFKHCLSLFHGLVLLLIRSAPVVPRFNQITTH
ncbi:hypothetical protein FKM82_004980 [Ascaphus truei]